MLALRGALILGPSQPGARFSLTPKTVSAAAARLICPRRQHQPEERPELHRRRRVPPYRGSAEGRYRPGAAPTEMTKARCGGST
jgi:hypothetical protein